MKLHEQPVKCLKCHSTMPVAETQTDNPFSTCPSCGSNGLVLPVLVHKAYCHNEQTTPVAK